MSQRKSTPIKIMNTNKSQTGEFVIIAVKNNLLYIENLLQNYHQHSIQPIEKVKFSTKPINAPVKILSFVVVKSNFSIHN